MQTNNGSKLLGQQIFLVHRVIDRCCVYRRCGPRALPFVCIADELAHSLSVIGEEPLSVMHPTCASAAPNTVTIYGLLGEVVKVLRQRLHKVRKLGRTGRRVLNSLQHHVQLPMPHDASTVLLCSLRHVRSLLGLQRLPVHISTMNVPSEKYRSHGWFMISSTPFLPIRWSAEVTSLIITDSL